MSVCNACSVCFLTSKSDSPMNFNQAGLISIAVFLFALIIPIDNAAAYIGFIGLLLFSVLLISLK